MHLSYFTQIKLKKLLSGRTKLPPRLNWLLARRVVGTQTTQPPCPQQLILKESREAATRIWTNSFASCLLKKVNWNILKQMKIIMFLCFWFNKIFLKTNKWNYLDNNTFNVLLLNFMRRSKLPLRQLCLSTGVLVHLILWSSLTWAQLSRNHVKFIFKAVTVSQNWYSSLPEDLSVCVCKTVLLSLGHMVMVLCVGLERLSRER